MRTKLYTGDYWYTRREAIIWANEMRQATGINYTPIKGDPHNPEHPLECWAITNRYDPKIMELNDESLLP